MARRRRSGHKSGRGKSKAPLILGIVALVILGMVGGRMLSSRGSSSAGVDKNFRISDYRKSASKLAGNRYRLEAKVEGVMSRRNDRLVVVSIPGNPKDERLPILVEEGAGGNVNLSRGKTYIINVECRNGYELNGDAINGVLVTRSIENKL